MSEETEMRKKLIAAKAAETFSNNVRLSQILRRLEISLDILEEMSKQGCVADLLHQITRKKKSMIIRVGSTFDIPPGHGWPKRKDQPEELWPWFPELIQAVKIPRGERWTWPQIDCDGISPAAMCGYAPVPGRVLVALHLNNAILHPDLWGEDERTKLVVFAGDKIRNQNDTHVWGVWAANVDCYGIPRDPRVLSTTNQFDGAITEVLLYPAKFMVDISHKLNSRRH